MSLIQILKARLYKSLEVASDREKDKMYRQQFDIHPQARLGYLRLRLKGWCKFRW